MWIDGLTGQIISRDGDGKVKEEHLELPLDVANGLPPNLLLNIPASAAETKVSYVAPGDKPRLIHLSIKPVGSLAFSVGGLQRKATDFKIHVELGESLALSHLSSAKSRKTSTSGLCPATRLPSSGRKGSFTLGTDLED
jgi:hypothetical protein